MRQAQRLALELQRRAAREVDLDGDSFVLDDPAEPAELVEYRGELTYQVAIVVVAPGNGNRGRRAPFGSRQIRRERRRGNRFHQITTSHHSNTTVASTSTLSMSTPVPSSTL